METQPASAADNHDASPLITPAEFRTLVARLRRNAHRTSTAKSVAARTIWLVLAFSLFWWWRSGSANIAWGAAGVVLINTIIVCLLTRAVRRDENEAKRLTRHVATTRDPAQLGTMLDLYDTTARISRKWQHVHEAARVAITRLLPLIQPENADALDTQQRIRLRRSLFRPEILSGKGYWIEPEYYFAALHMLKQIGDERDLPDVERLAKEYYLTDEVRAAAQQCAHAIADRLAREKDKDVLLRPERKPEAVAALLRPVTGNTDSAPQQLLRATISDDTVPPA